LPQPGSRPPVPELGETHGHNIVAADQGYSAVSGTAPGGTFPAINLSCTSCHDQHGQWRRLTTGIVYGRTLGTVTQPIASSGSYNNSPEPTATTAVGVYRLLRGSTGVTSSLFPGVPAAIAPSTYNRAETDNGLNQVRVAYGYSTASGHATWGDWCAACHANIHSDVGATTVHPIDENLGQTISDNYNAYVKTGDLTGSSGSSFWSLVPFVTGTNVGSNYGPLKTLAANPGSANLTGPGTGDQVSCLTCHRAHASGWHYGLRWPYQYELMTTETSAGSGVAQYYPNVTDRGSLGRTQAEYQAALNGRPATVFAPYQRVLCNKCHLKD